MNIRNMDKLGVWVLMSHLIITVLIIVIYAITLYLGTNDDTLKTILTVIIGYWFGSMGANAIRPNGTRVEHANEVKIEEPKGDRLK